MATIKANGQTYFIDRSKITTPSIKIANVYYPNPGYIPLFSGNKGGTVDYSRYKYTLGGLKVGNLRAAISRSFINSAPSVSISASSTRIANGTNVTITATASDPDGDTIYYEWEGVSSSSASVSVSGSNQTKSYRCRVHDSYSAYSSWSNQVSITWYEPNHSPDINIAEYDTSVYEGDSISVKFYYYDPDSDVCDVSWGYASFGSGGSTHDVETGYMKVNASPSNTYYTVTIKPGGTLSNGMYGIWVEIVDSKGAFARAATTVTKKTYTYKCGAKLFKSRKSSQWYGGSYSVWEVNIIPDRLGGAKAFAFEWGGSGKDSWYVSEYTWDIRNKPSSCTVYPITYDIKSETVTYNYYNGSFTGGGTAVVVDYKVNIRQVGNAGTISLTENSWTSAEWS